MEEATMDLLWRLGGFCKGLIAATLVKRVQEVIMANHFPVNYGQKDPHQYDVTITPGVISKTKSHEILKVLISHLGNMLLAYDGKKSAYVVGPLPFESKEFVVKLTDNKEREKEFKVNIKFAAKKDLHHLRQFLEGRQHDKQQETT